MTLDDEALFDHPLPPVRKGSREYLQSVDGGYTADDGTFYAFWALAPIDRYLREAHGDGPDDPVDFVWVVTPDHSIAWALVNTQDRTAILINPEPVERSCKQALPWLRRTDHQPEEQP